MIKIYSALHGMYNSVLGNVISSSQQLMTNTTGEEKNGDREEVQRLKYLDVSCLVAFVSGSQLRQQRWQIQMGQQNVSFVPKYKLIYLIIYLQFSLLYLDEMVAALCSTLGE